LYYQRIIANTRGKGTILDGKQAPRALFMETRGDIMNRRIVRWTVFFLLCAAISAWAANRAEREWWLLGRLQGNLKNRVITIQLVRLSDNRVVAQTSQNKYGHFAFSGHDKTTPGDYKLVLSEDGRYLKEVGLQGIRPGGRVPNIKIP
jgi:hypothetical protein